MEDRFGSGLLDARIAAIRHDGGRDIDAFLEGIVRSLRASGVRVAGYLQRETPETDGCCSLMHLEDISSGRMIVISQPLGSGSRGCRLDPRALAEASGLIEAELDHGAEFLVLNRFGKGEADGHGFRAVIEKAFARGIPVLTAVREAYAADWSRFGGDLVITLAADAELVRAWAERARARTREAAAA